MQFPGWRIAITGRPSSWGEVPILGGVIERLWLIIRIQCMLNRVYPDGCIKCCGESVPPLQRVETIRIAASAVMDGWKGHTIPLSDVFTIKGDLKGDLKGDGDLVKLDI